MIKIGRGQLLGWILPVAVSTLILISLAGNINLVKSAEIVIRFGSPVWIVILGVVIMLSTALLDLYNFNGSKEEEVVPKADLAAGFVLGLIVATAGVVWLAYTILR